MTRPPFSIQFSLISESALLLRVGDGAAVDEQVIERVWSMTAALDAARIHGVVDIVPGYCTILIQGDPALAHIEDISGQVEQIATGVTNGNLPRSRAIDIPVAYGDDLGPDLEDVARATSLSPDEVIALHASAEYRVACMGFAPGWAYLIGLPAALHVPRRSNPRQRVPAGSLAVGGGLTGVYPLETPGGWHLIGRSPLKMFDPSRNEPFLLQPGDTVRFRPISREAFARYGHD